VPLVKSDCRAPRGRGLVDFIFMESVIVDPQVLVPKRWDPPTTLQGLTDARRVIADVGAVAYEADELEPPLRALCEARGWKAGDLFMAIRVAVTGRTTAPPLFDSLVALGYERTLARLDTARRCSARSLGATTTRIDRALTGRYDAVGEARKLRWTPVNLAPESGPTP
jgi:glutamyl-tRNA synthetase